MSLDMWQKKIQEKRKNTPFRDFLRDIASWSAMVLYKNSSMITKYPVTGRIKNIVSIQDYNAKGNQMDISDINYNLSFWENLERLRTSFVYGQVIHFYNNEGSDFADCVFWGKNAYLSFVVWHEFENVLYSSMVYSRCTNILNSVLISNNTQNIYYSKWVEQSYNVFFSKYINNSSNLWFCTNCIGCKECILCDGLENVAYCIRNKQLSVEEYNKEKQNILGEKKSFENMYWALGDSAKNYGSENVDGNFIRFSENVVNTHMAMRLRNSRNCLFISWVNGCENFYDCFDAGINSSDFYGCCSGWAQAAHIYCSSQIDQCTHQYYSYHMETCHYCMGCIGLKNKSYCIFNKQYTKEERHTKVDEIFNQMDKDGTLGEFFPATMNPFYFNDTAAYLIDPSFTKEEVMKLWYLRRDEPVKVDIPAGADVVKVSELTNFESFDGDGNWYIDSSILHKIIVDEEGNYYKIVKMEYDFLVKHGLPLPRKHRLDRMKENFKISL
jgi:hypothetical protein